MFYTNYSAQAIWPVRKSFIDNYDEELVIIEKSDFEGNCNFFYQYLEQSSQCNNDRKYLDKIKDCKLFTIDKNVKLYFCKEKKKFIGGNQGLFFSDFPRNYPPDFIWDLESFPVAINITNLGETTTNELKIVFTDDFAKEEFDKEDLKLTFNETIVGKKRVNGNIILYEQYFDIGNLTFNHKLLNKNRYINASVIICYSYKTIIRVDMCEDSEKMCGIDVSAAPVQIQNFNYNDLDFNFSVYNSADGLIGDMSTCGKNSTKKIELTSDSFKCEPNKMSFSCQGVENRLKKGEQYYITINYDYQQEFKKALLLRSKELNPQDYESSN